MARPRKKIDPEQVRKLAAIQCTTAEMAAVLNCSSDTLERRFAAILKEGRANGCMSLKRKQYELAMSGNVGMLIWLGKQHLGQYEKRIIEASLTNGNPEQKPVEEAKARVANLVADLQCLPQTPPLSLEPSPGLLSR